MIVQVEIININMYMKSKEKQKKNAIKIVPQNGNIISNIQHMIQILILIVMKNVPKMHPIMKKEKIYAKNNQNLLVVIYYMT